MLTGVFTARQSLFIFIAFFLVFFTTLLYNYLSWNKSLLLHSGDANCEFKWHGKFVTDPKMKGGSCFCSRDYYCICSPSLAIDSIIETTENNVVKVVLVFRRDPPRSLYAIPGGFVMVGETVEATTIREVKEETNLTIVHMEQFGMYSDPDRDPRRHTASMVFRCQVASLKDLKNGDDAKAVKVVPLKDALNLPLAFDHKKILTDYTRKFHPDLLPN